jgi:hypothetical protein
MRYKAMLFEILKRLFNYLLLLAFILNSCLFVSKLISFFRNGHHSLVSDIIAIDAVELVSDFIVFIVIAVIFSRHGDAFFERSSSKK